MLLLPANTVHAPHRPSPQPNFVPVKCRSSRRTSSKGRSGSVVIVRASPLTVRCMVLSMASCSGKGVRTYRRACPYSAPRSHRVNLQNWQARALPYRIDRAPSIQIGLTFEVFETSPCYASHLSLNRLSSENIYETIEVFIVVNYSRNR